MESYTSIFLEITMSYFACVGEVMLAVMSQIPVLDRGDGDTLSWGGSDAKAGQEGL